MNTAALHMLDLGIVPVRLDRSEKNPNRKGWTKERPTKADVLRWRTPFNLGALCGSASGWYVDVDCDCDEAVALAPFYLWPTWVHGRKSRPRSHWGYIAEGVRYRKFADASDKTVLELRGEASTGSGVHSIWPPSVHTSGELVEWDPDYGDAMEAPLKVDGRALVTAVTRLACATIFMREGATIDEAREMERTYAAAPKPKAEPARAHAQTEQVQKGARCFVCGLEADSEAGWVTKNTCSMACVRKRARKYVDKLPGAISGSGGHDATFRVATVLARGFALDESDVLDILRDYNSRCAPAWTEAELTHKAKQAAKQSNPLGEFLAVRS